ncbi:hypothetical protein BDW66DRAFT_154335 [Aspergillus desertorum]
MLGLPSESPDTAAPYSELDAIREPNNPDGYFAVSKDDTERAQSPIDEEQPHGHAHRHHLAEQNTLPRLPLPPAWTFQLHVHCDICDGFLRRQQMMRTERFYRGMVPATVMFALLWGLMLGIAIACTNVIPSIFKHGWLSRVCPGGRARLSCRVCLLLLC